MNLQQHHQGPAALGLQDNCIYLARDGATPQAAVIVPAGTWHRLIVQGALRADGDYHAPQYRPRDGLSFGIEEEKRP